MTATPRILADLRAGEKVSPKTVAASRAAKDGGGTATEGPAMALPAVVLVWPDLTTTPGTSPISGCGSPGRSSQWNGSLNRSELEVQFLEAPEQKGAVPFEPTSACRTVLGL